MDGREYVVLDAQMQRFKDAKKNYAFTVQLRGVPEPLCFGTDEDSAGNEWIARLESASKSKGQFNAQHLYMYVYVIRKVQVRTVRGFSCANLGSEVCTIILGSCICCVNFGFTRNHLGSRNQTSAICSNKVHD